MNKKYDVSIAQEYEENGETKTRWVNLGIAFEKDGKPPRIKLNALPIPDKNGEIWISLFEQCLVYGITGIHRIPRHMDNRCLG